ncbi:MAG: peptide chain release factor N(5)-glutamine methyltransferase [Betaproteobacteria bacterium]|nr:peptide chain release factor N(5)-glutamine methyltransferase [Betaproteobacteria bacterium]
MTLRDWLAACGLARVDAQALAQHVLGLTRAQLVTHDARVLAPHEQQALSTGTAALSRGVPLAYVTGHKEFYSLRFAVSPAVLVPRPETELLVDTGLQVLAAVSHTRAPQVLDLGTGSGCIAIALAMHAPQAQVWAVDASEPALAVAARNNAALASGRVQLRRSDWFAALGDARFDLIVANPPYVAQGDVHLAALRHEPDTALTAGPDGLRDLRRIIAHAPSHLHAGGWLWLEHGHDQAAAVRALLADAGFAQVNSQRDLAGIERISGGIWPAGAAASGPGTQRLQFEQHNLERDD